MECVRCMFCREMQRLMGLRWRHSHAVNFVVNLGVYAAVVLFFWLAGNRIQFGEALLHIRSPWNLACISSS